MVDEAGTKRWLVRDGTIHKILFFNENLKNCKINPIALKFFFLLVFTNNVGNRFKILSI